jgi:hypothetical protein
MVNHRTAVVSQIRGLLLDRGFAMAKFGPKAGVVGKIKFEDRIRELVADHSFVAAIVAPLLEARAALRAQFAKLHRMLLDLVQVDPVCRRFARPGFLLHLRSLRLR